jgi:beta-lactamase regulating signal transducer with metallopeptidase domain
MDFGSGWMVATLLRTSLQGALFIAVIWLVCRLVPRLPAGVRCGLWWAACLKLLVGLVWIAPVEVALLPAGSGPQVLAETVSSRTVLPSETSPPVPLSSGAGEGGPVRRDIARQASIFRQPVVDRPPSPAPLERGTGGEVSEGRTPRLVAALLFLWLAGLAFQAGKTIRQLRFTRRVVGSAEPIGEGWVRKVFAELCALLGLRRRPELRASHDVRTPQALGLVRPLVLVPEGSLDGLSPAEVSMTLCHELVHLRRGDLWLGWVPALAHRIFFFHPLAALAAREYAIAREAACDAEVLRLLGSAPQAYGRLLLRWGVAPRETGLAAAGASPSLKNLKRRLQMLQQTSDLTSEKKRRLSGWWWLAGAVVVAGLIPLRIVAQQAAPEAEPAPDAAAAPLASEPALAGAADVAAAPAAVAEGIPGGVEGGVPGGVEGGVEGGVAGGVEGAIAGGVAGGVPGGVAGGVPGGVSGVLAAVAPPAPSAPRAAPAPRPAPRPAKASGFSWSSSDGGDSYVLLYGNGSATMSGSMGTLEKVKRLRGDSKADILWFRRDGKEYVVRDAAVLKQAREIFKPQMELGAKQGELGARQGELGAKQGELGAKQGELGGRQGALGAEMAALAAERISRDDDAADLEQRERGLAARMEELSRKQEELGRQQEALGRQQEELGRHQEALGRQQEAAGEKAQQALRSLIDRALQSGAAQEVR